MEHHPGGFRRRVLFVVLLFALLTLAGCELPLQPGTSRPVDRPAPQTTPVSPLVNQTVYWNQIGRLTALRASDGQVRWQTGGWWSAPLHGCGGCMVSYGPLESTLAGDTIYAVGNDGQNSAAVYAFATSDGTIRWQLPVTGCLAAPLEPPLVVSGVVYVSLTGHFNGSIGCKPTGWVYALRASDGHILWHVPFSQSVWPTLALTNGVLIVSNSTDNKYPEMSWLTGLRASDGKQLWRVTRATDKIEFAADGGVVVTKNTAGIRYDSGLKVEAFRASDGTSLWTSAVIPSSDPEYFMNPLLANGMVYIFSASGDLYALRARDGRETWRFQAGKGSIGVPAIVNGHIYLGIGASLNVLDAASGALVHSYSVFDPSAASGDPGYIWSAPAVTNMAIFVSAGYFNCPAGFVCHGASLIGKLYALDIATGKLLWQYQAHEAYGVTTPMLGA